MASKLLGKMPSKTKKQSKSALKTSLSEHSTSPQNSSSLIRIPEPESEEDLLCSLEEAAKRYPSLINKSAFIGQTTDVKAESKGCRIWLSESSIAASSITPGSTVSVLKNDVQLSSNLSKTLGCPDSGRTIFICPIQGKSSLSVNGIGKSCRPSTNCLSLSKCKELYLELVSLECGVVKNGNLAPDVKFPGEKTPNRSENGKISSPVTPDHSQSKLNSHVTSQSSSQRCEEPISSFPRPNGTYFNSFSMGDRKDGSMHHRFYS